VMVDLWSLHAERFASKVGLVKFFLEYV